MSSEDPKPKIYSFGDGQTQTSDVALDDALQDAVEGIARSLQDEEISQQRQQQRDRQRLLAVALVGAVLAAWCFFVLLRKGDNDTTPLVASELATEDTMAPQVEPPVATVQPAEEDGKLLGGDFTMRLPKGFEWEVRLIALEGNRYRMTSSRSLNSTGIYERQGQRLVMLEPDDKRLTEFEWIITSNDRLELVEQPPVAKIGSNYLGTALTRKVSLE